MDVIIKESSFTKLGLNFEQFCYLLSLKNRISEDDFKMLTSEKFIKIEDSKIQLDIKGYNAIIESNRTPTTKSDLQLIEDLAKAMAEKFPCGKKDGTSKYWRGNSALIVKKLIGLLKKIGPTPVDTILKATDAYINSFGNNTGLMRILPYFIEKDGESDLLTFIENLNDTETPTYSTDRIL